MNVSEARLLIETAEKFSREFQALEDNAALAKQAAVKAADDLLAEQVRIELCKLDLDELRKTGLSIRITALRAAGINDLGRLYGETIGSLSAIEGIGETSAQRALFRINSFLPYAGQWNLKGLKGKRLRFLMSLGPPLKDARLHLRSL